MSHPFTAAFIGLGVMGYPMAGHLARKGGRLRVFNRTREKAQRFVAELGGVAAQTPREAAEGADFVFTCVGDDNDLRAVTLAPDGVFAGMSPQAVFVDHTTASATVARELSAKASERGFGALDAPISGGQAGAENGALTVMCGGDAASFDKALPIIDRYARACRLMGGPGAGQLTKMVNQICIAGLVQSLSEGLAFASRAGLDAGAVVDLLKNGAAQSWQMDNRAGTMIADRFDFGFAVEWMRKDLSICLAEASRNGAQLPVAALVDRFYAEIVEQGGARLDTSSLIRRLPK